MPFRAYLSAAGSSKQTGQSEAVKVRKQKMKIEVEAKTMRLSGVSESTFVLDVTPESTAASIESELISRCEMLTGWRVVNAPEAFRKKLQDEGLAARKRAILRWNRAVIEAIPRVISAVRNEAASRGGNWGAACLFNLELASERAGQLVDNDSTPWGIGRFEGSGSSGVSHQTWSRVFHAVPEADRLPLGME